MSRPTRSQLRRHARRLTRDGYQPMMRRQLRKRSSRVSHDRDRPRHLALPLRTRPASPSPQQRSSPRPHSTALTTPRGPGSR